MHVHILIYRTRAEIIVAEFTVGVLTQNYRVPEHQLLSRYKVHPASHTNKVYCLKMPKFRCNLRGRKITRFLSLRSSLSKPSPNDGS